jgi:hypothetical protein
MMLFIVRQDTEDVVKLNIPLLLRLMEYATDATDEDLHELMEKIVRLTEQKKGAVLTMKHYKHLVHEHDD